MASRPKTDAERRYEAAKAQLAAAEKAVAAAERITSGHPAKITTKRRALDNLRNTIHHADADSNEKANRAQKEANLRSDIAALESELSAAETTLTNARNAVQTARAESTDATNDFQVEQGQFWLDNAVAKRETDEARLGIAKQGQELNERKFAQAEQSRLDAANERVALAEKQGASAQEIERYRAQATAANLRFEWQQRKEMEAAAAERSASEIASSNAGQLDLARLQAEATERLSKLTHGQALEIIKANEIADNSRATVNGEIHRENVTHETNEDIRKAQELLSMAIQRASVDTVNAANLAVINHLLRKDEMTHAHKIAQQSRAEELDSVAADMAEIARWNANPKKLETDLGDDAE